MNDYRIVRDWIISLLDYNPKPFTPEVNAAMKELWGKRDSVAGERGMIVDAFKAVLEYRKTEDRFTPYYCDQQDALKRLRREMLERARALKEYVKKYLLDEQEVLLILRRVGAIITDSHIVYTSGLHGTAYINKDAVYPRTGETRPLCRVIADWFADDNVQVVIAPAIGGVILSQWTAHHLTEMLGREVFGVYAEKSGEDEETAFVIKRGYDKFVADKKVLVVEDVLTTGGSAKKVVEAVQAIGGEVVGLGVFCNRGGITPQDVGNVRKLIALVNLEFPVWSESECPLCRKGVPINTDVGKGREFLARRGS